MTLTTKTGRGKKLHIHIDGEYALTTDVEYWYTLGLAEGARITPEELETLSMQIEAHKALQKAYDFLSRRDHSARELTEKLCRTVSRDAAQKAVERMEELGYVDDRAYAKKKLRELLEQKHMAVSRARMELLQKGICRDWVDEALQEQEPDPREQIAELIRTKYIRRLSDEQGVRRTFNALQRLGYHYSDIRSAMAEFIDEE